METEQHPGPFHVPEEEWEQFKHVILSLPCVKRGACIYEGKCVKTTGHMLPVQKGKKRDKVHKDTP